MGFPKCPKEGCEGVLVPFSTLSLFFSVWRCTHCNFKLHYDTNVEKLAQNDSSKNLPSFY